MKVLPEEHEQAGMRYPRVGDVIMACSFGERGSDFSNFEVLELSSSGNPVIDPGDGSRYEIADPLEWRWPNKMVRAWRAVKKLAARTVLSRQITTIDAGSYDEHYYNSLRCDESTWP